MTSPRFRWRRWQRRLRRLLRARDLSNPGPKAWLLLPAVLVAGGLLFLVLTITFAGLERVSGILPALSVLRTRRSPLDTPLLTLLPIPSGDLGRQLSDFHSSLALAHALKTTLWVPPLLPRVVGPGRQHRRHVLPPSIFWDIKHLQNYVSISPVRPLCGAARCITGIVLSGRNANFSSEVDSAVRQRVRWVMHLMDAEVTVDDVETPILRVEPVDSREDLVAFLSAIASTQRQQTGLFRRGRSRTPETCFAVVEASKVLAGDLLFNSQRLGDSVLRVNPALARFVEQRYDTANLLMVHIHFGKGCCRNDGKPDKGSYRPVKSGICLQRVEAPGMTVFKSQDVFIRFVETIMEVTNATQVYFAFSPGVPFSVRESLVQHLPPVPRISTLSDEIVSVISEVLETQVKDDRGRTSNMKLFHEFDASTQLQLLDEFQDFAELYIAMKAKVFVGEVHSDWSDTVRTVRHNLERPSLLAVTSITYTRDQLARAIAVQREKDEISRFMPRQHL